MKKQNPNMVVQEELSEEEKHRLEVARLEKQKKSQKVNKVVKNVLLYTFLTIVALTTLLPFYWMIMSSLKTEMEYRRAEPTFFPEQFWFRNYSYVLNQTGSSGSFWQILVNTLVVGLVSTSLSLVITIVTAYALAKMDFKGKNLLFTLMLGTMMIPGEMFTITNYITTYRLGWKDSFTIMIVPFLVSVYYIYLVRNNFQQIPESLYKAAKVDGLSDMGYLIKVMIPLTAPTLVSVTLLKFIGTWNGYIWPQLVNSSSWRLITNWVTSGFTDYDQRLYEGINGGMYLGYYGHEALTSLKMAAVCMVSIPLLILFLCFRKYIMKGVSKSGTKG